MTVNKFSPHYARLWNIKASGLSETVFAVWENKTDSKPFTRFLTPPEKIWKKRLKIDSPVMGEMIEYERLKLFGPEIMVG